MDKEKLDELWKQVEHIGNVDHFSYDRMVALGSVFGQMEHTILEQQKEIERLENIIHAIANIDTIFISPDGTDRDWNDKEAFEEIFKLVMPVWDEHCEISRKETDKLFKEWGIKTNLD